MNPLTYDDIVEAGKRSLEPGELWCIYHPDGPLEMTASVDFTAPVRAVCDALDCDWDELTEQGYYVGKIKGAPSPTATPPSDGRRAAPASH